MAGMQGELDSPQAEVCAACHSILDNRDKKPVIYGMDHVFCSEGCRCVFFFGSCSGSHGLLIDDSDDLIGKKSCESPCLHCDASCPHFASFAAGLVKNKWGFNKFVVKEDSLDGTETSESSTSSQNLIRL